MSESPIILVSPDMRPSVMGVARSLTASDLLQRFVTTVAAGNGHGVFRYLPETLRSKVANQLKRRVVPSFLTVPVDTVEFPEMVNMTARRIGFGEVSRHHIWEWAEQNFDQTVARRWAGKAPCLYGCEHASVETFRKQKLSGGYNILWQVIAHHQTLAQLLEETRKEFPVTATPYQRQLAASLPRINARKDQQYTDADLIVTNSEFSRQSFIDAGFSPAKVRAIQTGCPPVLSGAVERRNNAPMIFLNAGSQSIRKGIPYLLEAWRRLKPSGAELWLVGEMQLPPGLLENLPKTVVIKPPVPAAEMESILRQASVLVLPTLGEGLAHVLLEALAAGQAIITTANSGCGDLVQDQINGWIVRTRDSYALADRISWCIEHPAEVYEMQKMSQQKAAAWQEEDFIQSHAQIIKEFLAEMKVLSNATTL